MSKDPKTSKRGDLGMSLLVTRIVESYEAQKRINHLGSAFLPSRAKTIEIIELLRRLIFPGLFEEQKLHPDTIHYHVGDLLTHIQGML